MKELKELNRFKQLMEERGSDPRNWNWQSRDRMAGKKLLNESDVNSYDIEHMTVTNS